MTEETQDQFRIKYGGIRLLTMGEIKLAQSAFASTIDYSKYGSTGTVTCLLIYRIEMRQ